MNLANDMCG